MKRDGRGFDGGGACAERGASVIGGCFVWLQSHDDLPLAQHGSEAGCGTESAALETGDGSATQFDTAPGATGVSLDQWPRARQYGLDFGLWTRSVVVELIERKFIRLGVTAVGELLAKLGLTPQKPLQRAYQCNPEAIEAWQRERYPAIARQAKASGGEVYFWDGSGFRADAVQKGQTPVVERPGQRQSISAASAVNARGGFWYCTYQGGLNAELFVSLMRRRSKPVHLVLDGLPAHKTTLVKTYVATTNGMLTLHFLPGYASELNPDELVWSHMKRTGVARTPLRCGEKLQAKIEVQLSAIKRMPRLIRSFFKAPSVVYITGL